ncbi:hypothetical protein [Amycolatopsis sp. FDAARGOS 1241]|uniref:hypothetical protein n=1 Tax=Amycolatopsis sp. FDAARGOS 1241 TaxID=2778070 RepID=UPI00351BFCE5
MSPCLAGERDPFDFPLSSQHKMLESLTVFDDVRVPKDRVFLNRRPELAGPPAVAFVDYPPVHGDRLQAAAARSSRRLGGR